MPRRRFSDVWPNRQLWTLCVYIARTSVEFLPLKRMVVFPMRYSAAIGGLGGGGGGRGGGEHEVSRRAIVVGGGGVVGLFKFGKGVLEAIARELASRLGRREAGSVQGGEEKDSSWSDGQESDNKFIDNMGKVS